MAEAPRSTSIVVPSSAPGSPEFGRGRSGDTTVDPLAPRSDRGRRTRRRLVEAAARVFARDGFLNAKILEIAIEAEVAGGTFYNYFDTKEAIFKTVIEETIEQLFQAAAVPSGTSRSPWVRIETATRNYVRAYQQHADLLAILEQVATFNAEFQEMRRGIRRVFRDRIARGLTRMQGEGVVDTSLPVDCTAEALTSMVSNFCYVWLVLGEEYDEATAVATLTTVWGRGIGLDEAGRPPSSG